MVNTVDLLAKINECGVKKQFVANAIGVSVPTLWRKIRGKSEFKTSEIVNICKILDIRTSTERDHLFFCK